MNLKEKLLDLDIFLDNEYLDKYVDLIESNRYTEKQTGKTQCHHIIPKCYFKLINIKVDNSSLNKVHLLYKDHILAHCYLVLASQENTFKYYNRVAIDKILNHYMIKENIEIYKRMEEIQLAYESAREIAYKNNPMFNESAKKKHDDYCKTETFRNNVSNGMKKYVNEYGFSKEHREKLSKASKEHYEKNFKNLGLSPFGTTYATRSQAVYCILESGEKYNFNSIKDAGRWWYNNFKPFGEVYSTATYQRKIEKSIKGEIITFGAKNTRIYKEITNIKWYKAGGDANE